MPHTFLRSRSHLDLLRFLEEKSSASAEAQKSLLEQLLDERKSTPYPDLDRHIAILFIAQQRRVEAIFFYERWLSVNKPREDDIRQLLYLAASTCDPRIAIYCKDLTIEHKLSHLYELAAMLVSASLTHDTKTVNEIVPEVVLKSNDIFFRVISFFAALNAQNMEALCDLLTGSSGSIIERSCNVPLQHTVKSLLMRRLVELIREYYYL